MGMYVLPRHARSLARFRFFERLLFRRVYHTFVLPPPLLPSSVWSFRLRVCVPLGLQLKNMETAGKGRHTE